MITTKQLLLAALLLGAPHVAHAQPDEPKVESRVDEAAGKEAEAGEDPDPSRHFNYTGFHWTGKDEYGGKYGDDKEIDPAGRRLEEEPMAPPFVFMLLNFALLLWLVIKYGAPAARKLAESRHDQIKTALDDAAKLRDQAAKQLAEYEARIKGVDAEIKAIIDGIRADAEADKARILETAAHQAAQMKKDGEQRIAAEIDLARAQLTKEVSAAAANAAEKLLKDRVTSDDQNKLVTTFIGGVEAAPRKEAR